MDQTPLEPLETCPGCEQTAAEVTDSERTCAPPALASALSSLTLEAEDNGRQTPRLPESREQLPRPRREAPGDGRSSPGPNSPPGSRSRSERLSSSFQKRLLQSSWRTDSSSSVSSLTCSSQESDEVFSEEERMESSTEGRAGRLRKMKSWKTFFTVVHWSLKRSNSWVQLAGHSGHFRRGDGDCVLKRYSELEGLALRELMADALTPHVPRYYGAIDLEGQRFNRLQDLLRGRQEPRVLDCKMGVRTYLEEEMGGARLKLRPRKDLYLKMRRVDPEAPSPEDHSLGAVTKLQYMRWRETLSSTSSLAFRIEGLTTADGKVLKDFKQTRSREQITATLLRFTGGEVDILKGYLEQLRSIEEALGRSVFFKTHEVIGSSLLFVHESLGKPEVWLIDFGKTTALPQGQTLRHDIPWEEGNREDGYLLGLHNLMDIFSQALTQRLTDTETT